MRSTAPDHLLPPTGLSRSRRWLLRQQTFPKALYRTITVEADPPPIRFVFRLGAADVLSAATDLADGLELVPVRTLAGEEPRFTVELVVMGLRAKGYLKRMTQVSTGTYVRDRGETARGLVIDYWATRTTASSMSLLQRASSIDVDVNGSEVRVGFEDRGNSFAAVVNTASAARAPMATEWHEASEFTYWQSGVCHHLPTATWKQSSEIALVDPAHVRLETNAILDGLTGSDLSYVLIGGAGTWRDCDPFVNRRVRPRP